jgi:hypothetical protein
MDYVNKLFKLNESEFIDTEKNKNIKIYYIMKTKIENNIFEKESLNQNKTDNRVFLFPLSERNTNKVDLNIEKEDQDDINYLFKIISNKNYEANNYEKVKINYLLENKNYKDTANDIPKENHIREKIR